MNKIFALDLGTNSIGWALRNPELNENQVEKVGVITFNKGVGIGKTGEYSFAAERTKKRSTRRLYQARKYRLWATLEVLITEGYCPLTLEDLNKWRHYDKEEARKNNNAGRVYPVWNTAFDAWIKLDFDNDERPDYTSPYQLRKELAEVKLDFAEETNRFKLGRALYHIAQRRGFKSSRKDAEDLKEKETVNEGEVTDLQYSEKKKNKVISELFEKNPEAKTIGWLFACLEESKTRIRENITQYAIRENYKDEIKYIFQEAQKLELNHRLYIKLVETGNNKNDGWMFYKRPLRSQKGLIGFCTLEQKTVIDKKNGKQVQTGKYRAPISHPAFETFRAWAFLNNIKYKEDAVWIQLPLDLKQEIYSELFFRKSKSYFFFSEITAFLIKRGKNWLLNYSSKTNVTGCPVSARLRHIFGEDYSNIRIPKDKAPKSDKTHYDIEDIWHILFSCEDQEFIVEFAEQKLKLDPEKVKQFVIAWNALPVGYGMLSLHAMKKINVFLEKGLIYTEAVLLANVPEIIGKAAWEESEAFLLKSIGEVITENRDQKAILNVVNSLISKHKNIHEFKFGHKDSGYKLAESDFKDIQIAIEEQYGKKKWSSFSNEEQQKIETTVKDCYQSYFVTIGLVRKDINGERHFEIKTNNTIHYKTDSGYYRLPKLIDTLVEFLQVHFNVTEQHLAKLYHPSEINIYPPAKPDKDGTLKLGSPKTGSFKNPMAMRALHELRKLINYMIETQQIDQNTRIVVEVARDLNDANKRWAIEAWQRQHEEENKEFAEAITQLLAENKGINANPYSEEDIDKVRLFYEQHTEQTLPPVPEASENEKGKKKKLAGKDNALKWDGHGKKLIDKYRLWTEQGYQCLYTGKFIKLTDLFNENVIDFEHTLPRSQSFDDSLANLTLCYHDYNRTVKKNNLPTKLPNYEKEYDFGGSIGKCSAILPRLAAWKDKVKRIEQQIDFWKTKSKKAADKDRKDDAIRQRHLWQMELEYWKNKLDRFTIIEITSGFKNSQKVDTQLISKYTFHYLKTYFDKVDVQKGSTTARFRKIYQLQAADSKKDRSKHSHHAKDAAVLTLIPVAAKRDAILQKYYESEESNTKFVAEPPFKGFKREMVWGIDDTVLINNITNNQELTPAKRKVRKRGKEVFISGTNKNRWATGDAIRGQLHQETFYGAIKPAKKDDNGNALKDENGKFILDDIKYVLRVPFNADFNAIEKIVDEGLKKQIKEHVKNVGNFKKAFEEGIYLLDKNGKPHGNKIRHIRIYKDGEVKDPLRIKKQTNLSTKDYKQYYLAANATNSFFAIYQGEEKKDFDYRNLFDVANIIKADSIRNPKNLFESNVIITKGKKSIELLLRYVLECGIKILFKNDELEDLKLLSHNELLKRLYVYTNFEKDGRLNFKYHLEARNKIEDDYKDSEINISTPPPTLRFGYAKYPFLVEGYDFEVKIDGKISWLKN